MNLFLLVAVPLAAVAIHLVFFSHRQPFTSALPWIRGSVWSLATLVVAAFFSPWRQYEGSLISAFAGLTFTDTLLVPGAVVAAWVFLRKEHEVWELRLWITLVLAMAGVRDFASTSRAYDLNELFLIPLDRILIILILPDLVEKARIALVPNARILWTTVAVGLILTGPVFQVLSFAGWGLAVWALLLVGITAFLWTKKDRFLEKRSGSATGPTIEEVLPKRT